MDPASELADRLADCRQALKVALDDLLAIEKPDSERVLRERPAIEASLWSVEAQLALLAGDIDRALQCSAKARQGSAEARRAIMHDVEQRLAELERRLGLTARR
jgi:hypothetical protein